MESDPINPLTRAMPAINEVESMLPPGLKAGWKTSEFWITLVLLAAGCFMAYRGNDTMATILWVVPGTSYKAVRTILKLKQGVPLDEAQ